MNQINDTSKNIDITQAEIVDVEEYAKEGRLVPRHRRYRIRIDRERFVVCEPCMTGTEILDLVDKSPQEYLLSQKRRGGQAEPIAPDQKVDFTEPGIERFMTLPNDTTEGGAVQLNKREFDLPMVDIEFLQTLGLPWETVIEGGKRWVIVHEWPVCGGYNHDVVSIAADVQPGYPESQLDMIYVHPALERADGVGINALSSQPIGCQQWQRWSRHRTALKPWRIGVDSLETHLVLANTWFAREFTRKN